MDTGVRTFDPSQSPLCVRSSPLDSDVTAPPPVAAGLCYVQSASGFGSPYYY